MDSLDVALESGDTLAVDVMTEELQLCHRKVTLVRVDDNVMLTKALNHKLNLLQVLF